MSEPIHMKSRRRIRFSMKSLLLLLTLICVVLAIFTQPMMEARRNQQRLDHIVSLGAEVSVRGTIIRDFSAVRYFLAMFSTAYDRLRLYGLDFSQVKLSDDDLTEIVKLEHIQELDLSNTQITDEGLLHLQELKYLRKLNLSGTQVTDQGMNHLSKISTLLSLHVVRTQVTYETLEELDSAFRNTHFCEEKAIAELEALGVQVVHFARSVEIKVNEDWSRTIVAGEKAVDVCVGMNRKLSLTGKQLALLGYLPSLGNIDIHSVTVGAGGFATMKQLPRLKGLTIYFTNITDSDLEGICRQQQLENLVIHGCDGITDKGLAHLKALKNLRRLDVGSCAGISQEGFSTLIKELPDCQSRFQSFR